ncbi:MAG: hypothetical protein ACLGG6_07685 [Gammaproteobacteria bacterium]
MRTTPAASLLVAALVMLRQPCARSQATARLLLERAAEHPGLSPAEREACLNLADAIDAEPPAHPAARPQPAALTLLRGGRANGRTDAYRDTALHGQPA